MVVLRVIVQLIATDLSTYPICNDDMVTCATVVSTKWKLNWCQEW